MKYFSFFATALAVALLGGSTTAFAGLVAVSSYSYDDPHAWAAHWSTPASEFTSPSLLTNGVGNIDGESFGFGAQTVGFVLSGGDGSPQPLINVDLGGTFDVDAVDVYYHVDHGSAILNPSIISVSGSTDGVTYTPLGSISSFPSIDPGTQENRLASISVGGASVAYLQIDVRNVFDFVFLTEVEVQESAAVPEPTALLLLGLVPLGLSVKRRR